MNKCSLDQHTNQDQEGSTTHEQFMTRVHEILGSWVLTTDLGDIANEDTPQYDLYEGDKQSEQTLLSLQEELKPTS